MHETDQGTYCVQLHKTDQNQQQQFPPSVASKFTQGRKLMKISYANETSNQALDFPPAVKLLHTGFGREQCAESRSRSKITSKKLLSRDQMIPRFS